MTPFLSRTITAFRIWSLTRHVQRRISHWKAYHAAVERKDTRAKHDRWPALRDATNATLAAEIGRKWA